MASLNEFEAVRPLLVVRTRGRGVKLKDLLATPQAIHQARLIQNVAVEAEKTVKRLRIVRRRDSRYSPVEDRFLLRVIDNARDEAELLMMDDVFRLVDCRDLSRASSDFVALVKLRPPIFSITHMRSLESLPTTLVRAQLEEGHRQFLIASRNIKAGLARNAEFADGPTKRAIEKAAAVKKRMADARAARAHDEIERIRMTLPKDQRSSLKALAETLNASDVPTPSGRGKWHGSTVKRVLDRVDQAESS